MTKSSQPLTHACNRLGYTKQKLLAIVAVDPTFPVYRVGENGHWRCDPIELDQWIEAQKAKRYASFQASIHEAGTHIRPQEHAAKDAAMDLRHVICSGKEPETSPYWRNAKFVDADLPADIAAALNIHPNASFAIAIEHVDKLLCLPPEKHKLAMTQVAKRLAAYHADGEKE